MKAFITGLFFLLANCSSQVSQTNKDSFGKKIDFEDLYHYPYTLTSKDFLVVDTQQKMNDVFRIN